jgi:hypothetical protein
VFVVRGARKFLDRLTEPTVALVEQSTTNLGDRYAAVVLWKSQVALLVNESALLDVPIGRDRERHRAAIRDTPATSFWDAQSGTLFRPVDAGSGNPVSAGNSLVLVRGLC